MKNLPTTCLKRIIVLKKATVGFLLICGFVSSCEKGGEMPAGDPVKELNEHLQLPPGSFQVDPDTAEIDESIQIGDSPDGNNQVMPVTVGSQSTAIIPFSAPSGNVVAAGSGLAVLALLTSCRFLMPRGTAADL